MEYAVEAVKQGAAAVGVASRTHVVLCALKRTPDELAAYQKKIISIDDHIGIALAGLTSDSRVLRFGLVCGRAQWWQQVHAGAGAGVADEHESSDPHAAAGSRHLGQGPNQHARVRWPTVWRRAPRRRL